MYPHLPCITFLQCKLFVVNLLSIVLACQQAWSACSYLKEDSDKSKCTDRANAIGCDTSITEAPATNTTDSSDPDDNLCGKYLNVSKM